MNNNAKNKTKQIVGIGVMTAIIAVLSQITISLPTHVPVTLQTFAVALAGYFLGWKGGAVSALVYGLLGAIGVPVFAGWSGGFSVIVGPQPPEYMMDIPGMQDEMRRPMMLIVSANKKVDR